MTSIWEWKQEPASPLLDFEGDWYITGDNVAVEVKDYDDDTKPPSRAEAASKLLQDLDQWVKEEPFSDWLEEKIDLPIFEEIPVGVIGVGSGTDATAIGLKHQQQHTHSQQQQHLHHHPHIQQHFVPPAPVEQHTPVLLPEFDYVLNSNEVPTLPERSQREEDMVLTMLQEMQPHELDELVRMRVESLVESSDSCVESSRSSSQEESESAASPSSDSGYDDPDWTPEPLADLTTTPKRRRTTKPYSRTAPEEKRQRKKEQNKNAATRYRLKKKAEIEEILSEEKGLISQNEKLKTDLSELAREIKYLKSLMRDVFKAKGLLK